MSIGGGNQVTQESFDGIILALLPSMIVLAWLLWRVPIIDDSDF
jgi:hypothetical protein